MPAWSPIYVDRLCMHSDWFCHFDIDNRMIITAIFWFCFSHYFIYFFKSLSKYIRFNSGKVTFGAAVFICSVCSWLLLMMILLLSSWHFNFSNSVCWLFYVLANSEISFWLYKIDYWLCVQFELLVNAIIYWNMNAHLTE